MSRTARAAVFVGPNRPFVMQEYPLRAVEADEALVRVEMSTICRSDIHSWEGKRHNPTPGILGHEIIGTIEQLGRAVGPDMRGDTLREGDRVTWTEFFFCGACYYCRILDMPQKCVRLRKYGHDPADESPHLLGGFAEYCYLLPGTGIMRLPAELADEEATPLNCGVATMVSVTEQAALGIGDTVVVQGLGLLGLYGVALARARGARTVIGLDTIPSRLHMARRFGADLTFDVGAMEPAAVVAAVREACPPDGPDVVIEVCGVPAVLPAGLAMLRKGGRYIVAGIVFPQANVTLDANTILSKWITLRGNHNYHPRHLVQALDFVARNRTALPFKDIVDSRFALADLDTAFARAADRQVLRAAIVP